MQFSEDRTSLSLQRMLERIWKTHVQSITLLGEGVYGKAYSVTLSHSPSRVLIKMHKYPGMADQESRQLMELRAHLPTLVPHVYASLEDPQLGEVILMEWLPGQSCRRPEQFPRSLRACLQSQAVDLLLKLHTISHQEGYGSFDGPFYPRWWDYYGRRVQATSLAISSSEDARVYLGQEVLALMGRTLSYGERILETSQGRPVLLHGDFCFGNLLFDPQTWRISGLIDPLDAEWGERELDLVNVINGHVKHFELLNRYREAIDLGPHFPARYWFYQIWKWLFYYVRVGTKCREWVLRCGRELEKAVDRTL